MTYFSEMFKFYCCIRYAAHSWFGSEFLSKASTTHSQRNAIFKCIYTIINRGSSLVSEHYYVNWPFLIQVSAFFMHNAAFHIYDTHDNYFQWTTKYTSFAQCYFSFVSRMICYFYFYRDMLRGHPSCLLIKTMSISRKHFILFQLHFIISKASQTSDSSRNYK